MKHYLSVACALAGLSFMANTAQAGGGAEGYGVPANTDFYVGGSVGYSMQDGGCNAMADQTNCKDTDTGYKVYAGTRLNPDTAPGVLPIIGVEGGYIDFGKSSADAVYSKRHNLETGEPIALGTNKADSKMSGLYAAATASLPVAQATEISGKAGVIRYSDNYDQTTTVTDDPTDEANQTVSTKKTGFAGLVGIGAQYHIDRNWSVRGDYDRVVGASRANSKASDPSLLSVGAVFSTY